MSRPPGTSPNGNPVGSDGNPRLTLRLAPEDNAEVVAFGGTTFVRDLILEALEDHTMKTYTIAEKTGGGEVLGTVRAHSPEKAAAIFVRRSKRTRAALRVTGSAGMSGCFQGYDAVRDGGQTSAGPQIHVSET
ncbi:MAG: hypothetical protein ACH37Z_12335 [Anaerolineae bacterium]